MTRHDESVSAYEISKVEALNLTYMNRKRAIEKRISICPLKGTRKRSNKELAKWRHFQYQSSNDKVSIYRSAIKIENKPRRSSRGADCSDCTTVRSWAWYRSADKRWQSWLVDYRTFLTEDEGGRIMPRCAAVFLRVEWRPAHLEASIGVFRHDTAVCVWFGWREVRTLSKGT